MTIKEQLVSILEQNRSQALTSRTLSCRTGASISHVEEALQALSAQGYVFDHTQAGYRLDPACDILSAQSIASYPFCPIPAAQIHAFDTVTSTNSVARDLALAGCLHGTVVVADMQTAGRGRRGRDFYCSRGCGLYMSMVLCLDLPIQQSLRITAGTAVAVCRALAAHTGLQAQIKWVNDLYLSGKKVCGILAETVSSGQSRQLPFIILGIGINVTDPGFDEELRQKAGSLYPAGHAGISRNRLCAAVLDQVLQICGQLSDPACFMEEYRNRCMLLEQTVQLSGRDLQEWVQVLDVDDSGALIVRDQQGQVRAVQTGEVSVIGFAK